jgi:sodium/pantothenate symporter
MPSDDPLKGHWGPLVALALFTLASLGIGVVANRVARGKAGFLRKYFLGNRSMGAIAVALTAAVMSGGTFLGFPSLVYSFGWVVGLWIASYMVAPMTILGILGKRIGQLSRRTGAITLPDLYRERFGSPALGVLTSLLIIFFLTVFLVAQFKAGASILKTVLPASSYTWALGGTTYDLRLMPDVKDSRDTSVSGQRLVIISDIDEMLRVRVLDGEGKLVVDEDETTLTERASKLEELRAQLRGLWPPHELTRSEKDRIIAATATIVGRIPGLATVTFDAGYVLGLTIFAATVVAYTTYGGFLAAIWTDVFQSLVMALGVLILLPLALSAVGGLEGATRGGMAQAGPGFAFGPGAAPADAPEYQFHPIGLAFSFFVMWAITGMGQPATLVRLMAFRDSRTLRYSIIWQCLYNALIYIPLIFIFVAARSILPGLPKSDEVMPKLVVTLAHPLVAGLILAAPYGAVLSTVSGFLLIIASGLVRDVYQRFLRPLAGERELARASYAATVLVGLVVTLVALNPPNYLQLIIVFASGGMASAFLAPAVLGAFWRRATARGAIAAMLAGTLVTLGLYANQVRQLLTRLFGPNPSIGAPSNFRPYYLLGLDPCVWGLSASFLAGIAVSWFTRPPEPSRVALLFDAQPADAPAPATVALHPDAAPAMDFPQER